MKENKLLKNNQYPVSDNDFELWLAKYFIDEDTIFIPIDDLRKRMVEWLLKRGFGDDYWWYMITRKNNDVIFEAIRTVDEMLEEAPIAYGGVTLINLEGTWEVVIPLPFEITTENAMGN